METLFSSGYLSLLTMGILIVLVTTALPLLAYILGYIKEDPSDITLLGILSGIVGSFLILPVIVFSTKYTTIDGDIEVSHWGSERGFFDTFRDVPESEFITERRELGVTKKLTSIYIEEGKYLYLKDKSTNGIVEVSGVGTEKTNYLSKKCITRYLEKESSSHCNSRYTLYLDTLSGDLSSSYRLTSYEKVKIFGELNKE